MKAHYRAMMLQTLDAYETMVRAVGSTGGPREDDELEIVATTLHSTGVSILTRFAQDLPDEARDVTNEDLDLLARAHALVVTGLEQSLQLWKRRAALRKPA